MHSMTQQPPRVIGGVDAHADSHHVAALDERGTLLGSANFWASTPGYADALRWLESHGRVDGVAVESTGSYAAGLVRYLRAHLVRVVEVNQPHPHTRRRVGKSDSVDAEMAARQLMAGTATVVPKQTTGIVEAIRLSCRAGERRQSAHRRNAAGRRSHHHRSRSVTRPAGRSQEPARQGERLRPLSRLGSRHDRSVGRRQARAPVNRAANRSARPRDRHARPGARAAR